MFCCKVLFKERIGQGSKGNRPTESRLVASESDCPGCHGDDVVNAEVRLSRAGTGSSVMLFSTLFLEPGLITFPVCFMSKD